MMTILLVDDDRILTSLLSTKLQRMGLDVVVAHDAMQAFMQATRVNPDAIILDLNMPGGTGIDVLKKLKASAKTSAVPVIVLTASKKSSEQQEIMGLGASAFVYKATAMHRIETILFSCLPKSVRPIQQSHSSATSIGNGHHKSIGSLAKRILGTK
jgi:DNA-binding response OmpR family regulator